MAEKGYLRLEGEQSIRDSRAYSGIVDLHREEIQTARYDRRRAPREMMPELREELIRLAAENKDMEILEAMHARETPELFDTCRYTNVLSSGEEHCDLKTIEVLGTADETVLTYFASEFSVEGLQGCAYRFVYPFLGELLKVLTERGSRTAVPLLYQAIEHNKWVYSQLTALREHAGKVTKDLEWATESMIQDAIERAMEHLEFDNCGRMLKYQNIFWAAQQGMDEFVSNITRTSAASDDPTISSLIRELNDSYDLIHALKGNA